MLPKILGFREFRAIPFLASTVLVLNSKPFRDMNVDKGPAGVSNFAGSVDPHGERKSNCTQEI
jgi:hypothetical protein